MSGKKIATALVIVGIVVLGLIVFWFAGKTLNSREAGPVVQDTEQRRDTDRKTTTRGGSSSEETEESETSSSASLYTLDEGFRAEDGSNPFIISVDDDKIVLAYEEQTEELKRAPSEEKSRFVETTDGVTFKNISKSGRKIRDRAVQVANGTWRRYIFVSTEGEVISESSTDNVTFTEDDGIRYAVEASSSIQEATRKFGVFTFFADDDGGVVMLHNETTDDGIVVSRLYAAPETNGLTFKKTDENIIGGTLEIDHYADPYAITTEDGEIKLVVMHQGREGKPPVSRTGKIYTYTSTDDGKTFTLDGLAFSWEDFTDADVWSLNDPKIVQLSNGEFRIYAAAMVKDETAEGGFRWMIVSAVGP